MKSVEKSQVESTPDVDSDEGTTPYSERNAGTSYWRKLGGGSLSVSIMIHAVVLVAGLFWIFQVIPPEQEKVVDFKPYHGGGGGTPKQQMSKSHNRMVKTATHRAAAVGLSSNLTLPDPDMNTSLKTLGSLGVASGSGGLGGAGKGGGNGAGIGSGLGNGSGPGTAGKLNPFGMLDRTSNALVGTFYDVKQTPDRKPTGISNEQTRGIIVDFVNKGWKEATLSRGYFQAPQKLYQTKVYIPLMQAEGAPAAFQCEKDVEPSRWMIVYRGTVTPPKSGRYRFVGAGDDVLVVRFNYKHVFDHGFFGGTTGVRLAGGLISVLQGESKDRERERSLRDSPMKIPVEFYQYPTTRNWNTSIGGLAAGPWFEAKAGTPYPIEILLSEIPGGLFGAALMIEQAGEKYEKASTGAPILPLFRTDHQLPAVTTGDNAPPFQPDGVSWRIVEGKSGP